VSAALPIPVIQLLQVLTVAAGAPAAMGVIAKVEARLQGRRGPRKTGLARNHTRL
jgi:formate hydrogenlyase subunit 4